MIWIKRRNHVAEACSIWYIIITQLKFAWANLILVFVTPDHRILELCVVLTVFTLLTSMYIVLPVHKPMQQERKKQKSPTIPMFWEVAQDKKRNENFDFFFISLRTGGGALSVKHLQVFNHYSTWFKLVCPVPLELIHLLSHSASGCHH